MFSLCGMEQGAPDSAVTLAACSWCPMGLNLRWLLRAAWREVPVDLLCMAQCGMSFFFSLFEFQPVGLTLTLLWEVVCLKSEEFGLGHLRSPLASTVGRQAPVH